MTNAEHYLLTLRNMYKNLIGLLFILFVCSFCAKGEEAVAIDSSRIDSVAIQARHIQPNFYETYKSDSDFNYERSVELGSDSWWKRLWRRFWYWLFRQFDKANHFYDGLNLFLKIGFWILMAGILIFAVSRLSLHQLFYPGDNPAKKKYFVDEDEAEIENLDAAIEQEVRNQNFRKAIRYHFIAVLRLLNEMDIISLADEKTNFDYIKEIRKSPVSSVDFVRLVNIYNAVWYGHFGIDEPGYGALSKAFLKFKEAVGHEKV